MDIKLLKAGSLLSTESISSYLKVQKKNCVYDFKEIF